MLQSPNSDAQKASVQAADILRLVGVGRNEYISIMNKCKAKRLMWRVNKAIAKEMLPDEPVDIEMQPWWTVNVVNLGKSCHNELPRQNVFLSMPSILSLSPDHVCLTSESGKVEDRHQLANSALGSKAFTLRDTLERSVSHLSVRSQGRKAHCVLSKGRLED